MLQYYYGHCFSYTSNMTRLLLIMHYFTLRLINSNCCKYYSKEIVQLIFFCKVSFVLCLFETQRSWDWILSVSMWNLLSWAQSIDLVPIYEYQNQHKFKIKLYCERR
jgi:hypothetical protein